MDADRQHAADKAAVSYEFPKLQWAEIFAILVEWKIPFASKDVAHLAPETASGLYEIFVRLLTGYSRQDVNIRTAAGDAPYPELYKASMSTLGYYKALSKLMAKVGVRDFSVQDDLFKPEPARLKEHLSALINFSRFRDEKLEGYTQLTSKTDELLGHKQDLEDTMATLQQRLASLREQQQQQEPVVLKLTEETTQLEKEVKELNVKQAILKADIAKLKTANAEAAEQAESHKAQIASTENDLATIKAAIVENPEQMVREIGEFKDVIEHESRAMARLEAEGEQLVCKLKVIGDIERDVRDCVELLRECGEEERRVKDVERDVKEAKGGLERTDTQLQQTEAQREQLDAQLRNATEKMNRVAKAGKKKEKETQRELDKARQERARAEDEAAQSENKLAESARQGERLEARLLQLQDSQAAELAQLREQYGAMEAQVRQYRADLYAAMRTV